MENIDFIVIFREYHCITLVVYLDIYLKMITILLSARYVIHIQRT